MRFVRKPIRLQNRPDGCSDAGRKPVKGLGQNSNDKIYALGSKWSAFNVISKRYTKDNLELKGNEGGNN